MGQALQTSSKLSRVARQKATGAHHRYPCTLASFMPANSLSDKRLPAAIAMGVSSTLPVTSPSAYTPSTLVFWSAREKEGGPTRDAHERWLSVTDSIEPSAGVASTGQGGDQDREASGFSASVDGTKCPRLGLLGSPASRPLRCAPCR